MNTQTQSVADSLSMNDKPKIYVACLAAYNNGYLHGAWIDATLDVPALQMEIQNMLSNSPVPHSDEYAIHSYMGFGGAYISESESLESVSSIAHFVMKYGEVGSALIEQFGSDDSLKYVTHLMEDCYMGEYDSEKAFAESYVDETMDIPHHIGFYIDYDWLARDLFIGDFTSVRVDFKTHVFIRD